MKSKKKKAKKKKMLTSNFLKPMIFIRPKALYMEKPQSPTPNK
jgi:hypothetical protein